MCLLEITDNKILVCEPIWTLIDKSFHLLIWLICPYICFMMLRLPHVFHCVTYCLYYCLFEHWGSCLIFILMIIFILYYDLYSLSSFFLFKPQLFGLSTLSDIDWHLLPLYCPPPLSIHLIVLFYLVKAYTIWCYCFTLILLSFWSYI